MKKKLRKSAFTATEKMARDGLSYPQYIIGDSAIGNRRQTLANSRGMYQNNAIYATLVNRFVDAITGPAGPDLMATTGDDNLNNMIEEIWWQFSKKPDITGRFDWVELYKIVVRELMIAGEVLLIKVRDTGRLQLIESERIKSVAVNALGAYETFTIIDPTAKDGITIVKASDCIYCAWTLQPSQTRGTSIMWSSIYVINMLMTVLSSSAKSWAMVARLAFAVKKEGAGAEAWKNSFAADADADDDGTNDVEQDDDETNDILERFQNFGDGVVFWGEDGEDIHPIQHSGVPNADLEKQIMIYMRILSGQLGIDAATMLFNDWSKTNWSSSKAANAALADVVSGWQQMIDKQFSSRVFKWVMGTVAANPETPLPDDQIIFEHRWVGHMPSVLDQEKEAKSIQMMLDQGTMTHTEALLKRGIDRPEQIKRVQKEILDAVSAWTELQKDTAALDPNFILPPELFSRFIGVSLSQTANAIRQEQQGDQNQETTDGNQEA